MTNNEGPKTAEEHWNAVWQGSVRPRLPSRLHTGILNLTRLLSRHVKPRDRYLEIGCAPGKLLAWVGGALEADVVGLDYSEAGIAQCRALFDALRMKAELYRADFFDHPLPPASFDVVASFGFIEHFDDPTPVVQRHVDLLKPGGLALITVPHYGGVYGKLQHWCDAPNLALHNTAIMNPRALAALADAKQAASVKAYPAGVLSPWIVNLERKLPGAVARACMLGFNALGLVQPVEVAALAPMLVLEIRKSPGG